MIQLKNISKQFDKNYAVKDLSLEINDGEFFALLGPSGCGKTTLLRVISGFEVADQGQIFIDQENITNLKPFTRPTNLMFQSYALFPHYTVRKNIAYGLERERQSKGDIDKKVSEIILKTNLKKKTRNNLSGVHGPIFQQIFRFVWYY